LHDSSRPAEQFASFEVQERAARLGMWAFLGSETLLFSGLFALYAAYRTMYPRDFAVAAGRNILWVGTSNTIVLVTSSLAVALAVHAIRHDRPRHAIHRLGGAVLLGFAFLGLKAVEYTKHIADGFLPGAYYRSAELPGYGARAFFTLYWFATGLHALHVIAGMIALVWIAVRTHQGRYSPERHVPFELGSLYWHLVDVVWIFLWPLLYLAR
jgi:cytochrome c oxidase subunit 3